MSWSPNGWPSSRLYAETAPITTPEERSGTQMARSSWAGRVSMGKFRGSFSMSSQMSD